MGGGGRVQQRRLIWVMSEKFTHGISLQKQHSSNSVVELQKNKEKKISRISQRNTKNNYREVASRLETSQ